MLSQSIEDYLKVIYDIQSTDGKVTTTSLAGKLGIAPASVTGMLKKLSAKKLVTHKKYQGVQLTESGTKIALEVIRHHRLIELYLKEALGVPWDRVHEEAEKWEHVLSEDIEDRIDKFLGHPTSDPHGSPIPSRDGKIIERDCSCLADIEPGHKAVIAEVSDHDASMLRYLGELGFYPETNIVIDSVEPFNGPMKINIKNKIKILGREVARYIAVTDVKKVA